ncbi:hypothetical protein PTTG_29636 [Puccinia triticina 1-1 BBBD Race 1]|uniref:Uncharacterized protein n=2 Tax=Puccinia triticina TaxID=208348 RepID=A0A180G2P9_PUCT1|nr:hypothetical protein PTTG_29636 [Puccinia triticina 1-1 BBBD Race 1]
MFNSIAAATSAVKVAAGLATGDSGTQADGGAGIARDRRDSGRVGSAGSARRRTTWRRGCGRTNNGPAKETEKGNRESSH